jgi:hypothetical protein
MFDQETKIGDLTLKPGHYQIQHRVEGSDHIVHFTEFKGMHHQFQSWSGPSGLARPGEVKCSLEPLQAKASHSNHSSSAFIQGSRLQVTRPLGYSGFCLRLLHAHASGWHAPDSNVA